MAAWTACTTSTAGRSTGSSCAWTSWSRTGAVGRCGLTRRSRACPAPAAPPSRPEVGITCDRYLVNGLLHSVGMLSKVTVAWRCRVPAAKQRVWTRWAVGQVQKQNKTFAQPVTWSPPVRHPCWIILIRSHNNFIIYFNKAIYFMFVCTVHLHCGENYILLFMFV